MQILYLLDRKLQIVQITILYQMCTLSNHQRTMPHLPEIISKSTELDMCKGITCTLPQHTYTGFAPTCMEDPCRYIAIHADP